MTVRPDRPARILVVDDEPLNVDYLQQELESHGFVTETAANGVEALTRVAAAPPDLVLLDVMMPELDGIAALRILKSDPDTKLIPVLLMTALNAVEDRVRGIEAGADDFLSKPVDERELLARIGTALSLRRTIDETVDELRSTREYLAQYGRQERDVAILAVEWRPRQPGLPAKTAAFLARRERRAAEAHVRAFGGAPSEGDSDLLIAVFDGADRRTRCFGAVDAALAVVSESGELLVTAAVDAGLATVGSVPVQAAGATRWVYAASGGPVETASRLAHEADPGNVVASGDAAAVVSPSFDLSPAGDRSYHVVRPVSSGDEQLGVEALANRRIRTIMATDIVGSTGLVERIGDRAWGELIGAHLRAIRAELVRFGGEELDTAGDAFLGAFDSPTRAILCALEVIRASNELQLPVRAGVHTGEVERFEGRARGITLHITSRIAERADPGELLVSATTRELAAGSGLVFVDRGEHVLKGVRRPRRLYTSAPDPDRAPVSRAAPYPAGLTGREVEVLKLVAVGLSDAETADRLFVSVRTVNAHLRSIYRKLGIRSRVAAGRFAQEHGLV